MVYVAGADPPWPQGMAADSLPVTTYKEALGSRVSREV